MWEVFSTYNMTGVAVCICVWLVFEYINSWCPRQKFKQRQYVAFKNWQIGSMPKGQVRIHHSGRRYILLTVTNTSCDDPVKWPIMAVYCDVNYESVYSRPLHEFAAMKVDKTVDPNKTKPFPIVNTDNIT